MSRAVLEHYQSQEVINMDYVHLPGIQIGRFYVENLSLELQVLQCTHLIRVQLILDKESKHYGMYEVVCCSPYFEPIMQLMMWLELDVAKTKSGKEFTGCPEYALGINTND